MNTTIPANNIGAKTSAYILVAQPDENTQNKVTALLEAISQKLPGVMWSMPASALHITLLEMIHPKEYSVDKDELYKKNQSAYEDIPTEVFAEFSPIEVTFDTIEVSPNAIIVRGTDNGSFNKIRAELVQKLPLHSETKLPPDIIHSSIARFTAEIDVAEVQKVVAAMSFSSTMVVDTFKLLKNHTFPLLEYETLKTYTLR